jgi:D-alanyl-D-alanine carboxypeptidase
MNNSRVSDSRRLKMRASIALRKSRLFLTLAIALLLALVPLCAGSCGSSGGGQPFSKNIQNKLGKAVDATMAEFGVPGAIVGVWVPGKGEWLSVRGEADIKTGKKPKLSDHVRIGSISKTFTAVVILQLVDEGKLALDDKLDKFDLDVTVPNSDRITIRNLLNMTSGLFDYTASEQFWADLYANPTKPWTPKQLVAITAAQPPKAEPGQGFDYCNTNYILLGLIIEKVTGRSVKEEITTRTIDKLGLKNTSFPLGPPMPDPFMHGYTATLAGPAAMDVKSLTDISIQTPTGYWTAGAVISDLEDLKKWVKALADGTLVSARMHEEQVKFSAPNTEHYGLGINNAVFLVGHSGEVLGYNSNAYTQPGVDGATIVIFINRYPCSEEGVSDQVMISMLNVLGDKIKGNLFPK